MSRRQMITAAQRLSNANIFIDVKSNCPILFPASPSRLFDVPFCGNKCHCGYFSICYWPLSKKKDPTPQTALCKI